MTTGSDIAIVGGGIVGCTTAWWLTELGATSIVLFERQHLASGATGVCPGGVRQQFEGEDDCRLARHSLRFYEQINERLAPEMPFVFERSGYLFLAHTEERLAKFRANVALQNRLGIPSQIVGPADAGRLGPALDVSDVVGAAFCAEDGFLEDCHGVTNLLFQRARERGATPRYAHVERLERRGEGWRLVGPGVDHEASCVVVAAGVDSVPLAASAGVSLPIVVERRRLLYTGTYAAGVLPPLAVALDRGFAGKQLTAGLFYMGWLGESEAADDLTFTEETLTRGARVAPIVADLPAKRVISGLYDTTPDRRPLLGPVSGVPGLFLATGFSGHGFMIAPAVGEAVAKSVVGAATELPLPAFSLDRFAGRRAEEGLFI